MMTPRLRKLTLTAHITSSVGWLGAVAVTLIFALAGLISQDATRVRAVYLTMEFTGWTILVPFSLASLLTGLVQSLGTRWGLFRHYWILAKLLINVLAAIVLLMYMQTLGVLADLAADSTTTERGISDLRSPSAVVHSGAAVLLLLMATALSVYKPKGMTSYGQRQEHVADNDL